MGESDLEKAAIAYANKARVTHSEQAAYVDGALHLVKYLADCVMQAIKIGSNNGNTRSEAKMYNDGYNQGCKDMLANLKSYCGRK